MKSRLVSASEVKPGDRVVYWRGTQSFVITNVERAAGDHEQKLTLVHADGRCKVSRYAALHVECAADASDKPII